jgi:hypothetical protein
MEPNPYASPAPAAAEGRLDRPARAALAATIRGFLDDRVSAFALDEALDEFRDSSDPTVRFVALTLWYHYDDCRDHMVALSKAEWDYFQRLLLVLHSDCQVATTWVRRWSWTQLAAIGCLVGLGWCLARFGWGQHLLVLSIPFGLVSVGISYWRRRSYVAGAHDQILVPFASFAELSAVYRTSAAFTNQRYPRALAERRIRSRVAEFGLRLQLYAAWLMLSPLPLLVQAFPQAEARTQMKMA